MSRKSTTIWIASAAVFVAAGIGVAAHAVATSPTAREASAPASSKPASAGSAGASDGATGTSASPGPAPASTPAGTPAAPSASATTPAPAAPTTTAPVATVTHVTPLLSYYSFAGSTLTLGAGVNGLVESGGTCTVTATHAGATVTQSFAASAGPSSTDCGGMTITSSKFVPGTWNLSVAYSSAHAQGVSAASQVTL